jgi:predicted SAM-dependent methyltransferase
MVKNDPNHDKKVYLNLGCGSQISTEWINLDVNPYAEEVNFWDASQGIPYDQNSVDVIYHSHLLEHLSENDGRDFLLECYRALKPGGILRIAVPDLEEICKQYLLSLQRIEDNGNYTQADADWMRLELLDQITRTSSGGKMLEFLTSQPRNKEFILSRCGEQVRNVLDGCLNKKNKSVSFASPPIHLKINEILFRFSFIAWLKENFLKFILNDSEFNALKIGLFQLSGETHKHMYDQFSLKRLLHTVGFTKITKQTHKSSFINSWETFYLDNTPSAKPRKPDSLYMEALKPVEI